LDPVRFSTFNIRVDEQERTKAQCLWPDLKAGQSISMYDFLSRCFVLSRHLKEFGMQKDQYWTLQGFDSLSTLTLTLATIINEAVAVPLNPGITGKHLNVYLDQIPCHGNLDPSRFGSDFSLERDKHSHAAIYSAFQDLFELRKAQIAIFSSGTSGKPKAIVHSLYNLRFSALASNRFYGLNQSDSWLVSLGLFHVGGLMIALRCMLAGATLCIGSKLSSALRRFKPSLISLVPTQLMDLSKSSDSIDDLKLCRVILVGGAGYSSELLQIVKQNLLPVSFTYGSSETGAQVAATMPGVYPSAHKVAGQILPGRQLRIDDDGHIQIKDSGLMLGYWIRKNFHSTDPDKQWYSSSDLGKIQDGELTVLGRSDDVYMVGGEGVSLSEVQLLLEHGAWQGRMYAVMLEDERLGFAPCAVIESAQRPQIKQLVQQLEEHLPSLKRPRSVYWHQVDLLTAGEKPNRSILKAGVLDGSFECLWRRSESD
jgi:O-succinylbenzoic acid--CoA ligase